MSLANRYRASQFTTIARRLIATIESKKGPIEVFDAWRDGESIQIRAISAFGDPADLGFDEVREKIEPILDSEE